jgi:heat shock protein HtpX
MAQTRSRINFIFRPQGSEQELSLLTRAALAMQGANGLSVITPETHPELSDMLQQVSEKAKLPTPRAYVWHSSKPVANAVAMSGGTPTVAFSETITQLLSPQELTAVAAHELGHVRNMGASQNLGLLAGMGGMALAWLGTRPLAGIANRQRVKDIVMSGKHTSHAGNAMMLAKDFAVITGAMAGAALASRSEEYAADRYGAMLMQGDGAPLMSGLQKLMEHNEQNFRPSLVNRVMKPLGKLTASHPSFEQRRQALGVSHDDIAQYRATQQQLPLVSQQDVAPPAETATNTPKTEWQQRVGQATERQNDGPAR